MVTITNGQQTLEVTRGAFEDVYKAQGFQEIQSGQGQVEVTNGFTGQPEDRQRAAQEQSEQRQRVAQEQRESDPIPAHSVEPQPKSKSRSQQGE